MHFVRTKCQNGKQDLSFPRKNEDGTSTLSEGQNTNSETNSLSAQHRSNLSSKYLSYTNHYYCARVFQIRVALVTMAAAARKAWNEAMKATAGATALPPALQQRPQKRRSDRHKKQERRTKARKVQLLAGGESDEFQSALWIDALEGVDPLLAAAVDDVDEEYDELDDLEASTTSGGKRSKNKRGRGAASSRKKQKAGVLPTRFLPRSLGSILVEEAGREDGVAKAFLHAEARLSPSQQRPRRKFCPVTGLIGLYTEPKSGIPYANLRALEQIRERAPPWMTLGGAAAYLEAVKSINDEE